MWLLWAVPAAIILLFSGLIGTKTTKRWAKKGRKKLYGWTKKRTTQRWQKRKAARSRISTSSMVKRRAAMERTSGKKRPAKPAKPEIQRHKHVCNGRTQSGKGCLNPTAPGRDRCHLHALVSVR